jgi:hypothetical protein
MLSTENYCYGKTAAMDLTREAFTSPEACVMLAGEVGAAAAHVRSVLIDLIEAAVHDGATKSLISQVAHQEIMSSVSKIHEISSPPYPDLVALQPLDKRAADKPAGPAY